MEAFLHFWNSHDTVIIQMLVVVILLMVIFLSLRFLFSKDHKDHAEAMNGIGASPGAAGVGAVPVEIESVLQKILENQSHAQALSGQGGGGNPAEVAALQGEMQKRQERVRDLEKEVADLQAEMANNAKKAAGLDPVVLKETVTRLESRLSEYEIISEDIADLSFYKEENVRLQAELAKMKMAPPAAVSAPASVEVSQAVDQPAQESAPASGGDAASTSIDDDIMAQFAAAVEEQKAAKAAKNMAPPVQKPQVDGELMGQFEEFVKKG